MSFDLDAAIAKARAYYRSNPDGGLLVGMDGYGTPDEVWRRGADYINHGISLLAWCTEVYAGRWLMEQASEAWQGIALVIEAERRIAQATAARPDCVSYSDISYYGHLSELPLPDEIRRALLDRELVARRVERVLAVPAEVTP